MQSTLRQPRVALGWMTFLLIAVVGLFYVKWFPYYNRAFVAASQHSIGKSILMGTAEPSKSPSTIAMGGAGAGQERFRQRGERWPDVAAGHDVHVLRGTGRGRSAGASGGAGCRYCIL